MTNALTRLPHRSRNMRKSTGTLGTDSTWSIGTETFEISTVIVKSFETKRGVSKSSETDA